MVKRLSQLAPPMVDYESHHGVMLTEAGRSKSMKIIRHHRLLETFLVKVLGYSWDEVHDEAERLEHHVSERLEERIADYLGHPEYDPHGAPIPTKEGYLPQDKCVSLNCVREGQKVRVARVEDEDREKLRYLRSLGLVPDMELKVMHIAPFDGPIDIWVGSEGGGNRHAIGVSLAESVMVEVVES